MRTSLVAFAVIAGFFASLPGRTALAQPNPGELHVVSIALEGSGCPQGSVGQSFSNDRRTFTLIFDSYVASTGMNIAGAESKKDCVLTATLNVPSGFRGGELSLTYRGYRQLAAGMRATHKRKYSASKTAATTALVGARSSDYVYTDPVAFTKVKSCNGNPCLVAKTKIAIDKSTTTSGQLTIDSIDGSVTLSN